MASSSNDKVDTGDSILSREKLMEKYKQALTIAQKAKNARDEAIKDNKVIIKENENLREKVQTLEKQYGTAEEMLAALTEQKLKLAMEIDDLKKQKALFIHELKSKENAEIEAESFKRQYNRLLKENEDLIQKFGSTETDSIQLRKEFNELKKDNKNLKQLYNSIQSEKLDLDQSFKETLERLYSMEQTEKSLNSILSKKFNKVVDNIGEWKEIIPSFEENSSCHEDLLSEIENLKAEKEKSNNSINLLNKEKENFEQEVLDLNERIKNIREELDVANSDRDKMMSNLEKVGLETKFLIENSEKLTDEIEILKEEKARQDQAISFLQNEKHDLTRIIHENETEINRICMEFSNCQRLNEELAHKIKLYETSNEMNCPVEFTKSVDLIELKSGEVEGRENNSLIFLGEGNNSASEKSMQKEGSVNSELNQLQEELQVFSCEMVKYKTIADEYEQKYLETGKALSEKEEELKQRDAYIEELQKKVLLLDEEIELLTNSLSKCKLQLSSTLDLFQSEELKNEPDSDDKELSLIPVSEEFKDKGINTIEKLVDFNQKQIEKTSELEALELQKCQTDDVKNRSRVKSLIDETNNFIMSIYKMVEENKLKFKENEREIYELKAQIRDFQHHNDILETNNVELNKQLKDNLNEQATENNNLVQKLTCLQDSLQSQVTEKQTVISNLEQEVTSLKSDISSFKDQNENISSENVVLKTKLESLKSSNSEKIASLTELNTELQEKLSCQVSLVQNKDIMLLNSENELKRAKDEYDNKTGIMSQDLNKLILTCYQKLMEINKNVLIDISRLRKDDLSADCAVSEEKELLPVIVFKLLDGLNKSQCTLHEEVNKIIDAYESALDNESSIKNKLDDLQLHCSQLSRSQDQYQETVDKLEKQLKISEKLEKEKIILIEQTAELSDNYEAIKVNFDKFNNEYSGIKSKCSDLENELESLKKSQNEELLQHKQLVSDMEQEIKELKKVQAELKESEKNKRHLETASDDLNKKYTLLNEENSALKSQIKNNENLINERHAFAVEIKTLSLKIEDLTAENVSLSQNLSIFTEKMESLRKNHLDESNQMADKINKMREELKNCNELLEFKTLELKENNRIWAGRFSSLKSALIGLDKSRKEIGKHFECIECLFVQFVEHIKETLQEKVPMVVHDSLSGAKHELITEMLQMNQALKERGESISKLEFAITEYQNKIKQYTTSNENLSKELQESQIKLKEVENFVDEKDSYIKQLEEENEQLKEGHDNTADADMLSTSTISRTEELSRLKDVEDSFEDRYSKLKLLALKMKKRIGELNQTLENERSKMSAERNELQEKISGMSVAVKNAQKLQELFDQSLDERDDLKKKNKSLEDTLEELKNSEDGLKNKIIVLESSNQSIPVMKKHIDSLNGVIKENKAELQKLQMENKAETIKYDELKKTNVKLETKLQDITSSLEQAKLQGKNSNVLELEIKNYEKIISELSSQVNAEKNAVKRLQSENEAVMNSKVALEEQIIILEKQIKVEEERNQHTNDQLNSTRNKLEETLSQIESLNSEIEDLQKKLDHEKQKNEALTLEMSQLTSEFSKKEISMTSKISTLQEQIRSFETSLLTTKQELDTSKHEIDHLHEEYESYKLRAQTILAKKKGEFITHGEKEAREELEGLKKECQLLEEKIEAYITETDTLNTRLSSLTLEKARSDKKYEEMKQALHIKITDYDLLNTEYHNFKITSESSLEKLKDEMQKQKSEYQSEISHQQKMINDITFEFKLKEESLQQTKDKNENPGYVSSFHENIPLPLEREDGEGSESVPSPKTQRRSSIVPLDILLNNPIVDENKVTVLQDQAEKLRRELTSYEVRCRHLSSLLSEAEKDSARNLHQNKILKEELRRLERSLERQPHVANTEYLKNVVFKFVTLPHGDERSRLIPVLDTLLKLSPEENHKLNNVAKGESQAGWGSYLQSWTGL